MLSIRLPEEIEARLERLAKQTGRTKSFYAREAILEKIEDMEDVYLAEHVLERIRKGEENPERGRNVAWPGGLSTPKASRSPFAAWIGRCSDGFGLSWRSDWPAWTIRASLVLRCRGHGMVICGVTVSEIIVSWPR